MANLTLTTLSSQLTELPAAFASGDTVTNTTNGLVTVVIGKETTVGGALVVLPVNDTKVLVGSGETSAAITLAAGEGLYLLNTNGAMSSTIDKVIGTSV